MDLRGDTDYGQMQFCKSYDPGIYDAYAGRGPISTWEYGTELYGRFFYLESRRAAGADCSV